MDKEKTYSRILGALSGVAVGDAFGMPCEMWSQRRIRRVYGYIDRLYPGNPENEISAGLQAGEVTDDTIFTLIISQLLIENKEGIDPETFVERIRQWANSTRRAKMYWDPARSGLCRRLKPEGRWNMPVGWVNPTARPCEFYPSVLRRTIEICRN